MGSNPCTESNYKTAVNSKNKMQMLCMQPGTTVEGYNQRREPKNAMHSSTKCAIDHVATLATRRIGEMRVRNHRSPSHPGKQHNNNNEAMAAKAERRCKCVYATCWNNKHINICETTIASASIHHITNSHLTKQQLAIAISQIIQAITSLYYKLQSVPQFCSKITTKGSREIWKFYLSYTTHKRAATLRFTTSQPQPPRLVWNGRASREESNATSNVPKGGRKRWEFVGETHDEHSCNNNQQLLNPITNKSQQLKTTSQGDMSLATCDWSSNPKAGQPNDWMLLRKPTTGSQIQKLDCLHPKTGTSRCIKTLRSNLIKRCRTSYVIQTLTLVHQQLDNQTQAT
ncbi:hypothetical protein F511_29506 [Dorcoceras hygrometricum]|uniref:Uncharacterized protein n=1 Tax=Dorcoceras hygrometricum TaxID=472368 RepID=A0A2Z7C670_9LAMI|nr:hypothetical protein F511_29506 [Dorcoceras hygrometricum]